MFLYSGQTRSRAHIARLRAAGIGECCVRGEMPPRRGPWFYDNGGFRDFQEGHEFDWLEYMLDVRRMRLWSDPTGAGCPIRVRPELRGVTLPLPAFSLLPDLVARGAESLAFTARFLVGGDMADIIGEHPAGVPLYVAVQNGMTEREVAAFVEAHQLGGIFVGGDMEWKLSTAAAWVRLAHGLGVVCHIGRAMSMDRLRWARDIGADSVDGNAPNWSVEAVERVTRALAA